MLIDLLLDRRINGGRSLPSPTDMRPYGPLREKRGSGTVQRQSAVRRGQRGAKLQPGGKRRRSGGLPGIASMSRSRG